MLVFAVVFGGWTAGRSYMTMHRPLPGAGGRQGHCVIWFVGSSSIFRWQTLAGDMAPWITRNRGVGGAFLPELRQRFANEDAPAAPDAIVFYGGDNDIANGADAAGTAEQFRQFAMVKIAKMPRVPMFVLSVKPSPQRWPLRGQQVAFDQAVSAFAARTPNFRFVDASAGLLVDGRPGPFFEDDGIHLAPAGYRVWARVVHRALVTGLPRRSVDSCMRESRLEAKR